MAIKALDPKFADNIQPFQRVNPVVAVASNPFYEQALQNAGLKFNDNPSLLGNPQAKMCYLA